MCVWYKYCMIIRLLLLRLLIYLLISGTFSLIIYFVITSYPKLDLISGFARATTNPCPGIITTIKSQKCESSFCHGATDYINHPSVRKTVREYTERDYYWLDRSQKLVYPALFL